MDNLGAQEKLDVVAPHIKVLSYVPSKKGKSLFKDTKRDLQFEYFFFPLLKRFKEYKDFVPCPTREEKDAINRRRVKNIQNTCEKKYGVKNPRQIPGVSDKVQQTVQERYGVSHISESRELKEKKKARLKEKYGVENVSQLESVQAKRSNTFSKYQGGHPLKDPTVRKKQVETAIKNGNIRIVEGKTCKEWANKHGLHYQTVSQNYNKYGPDIVPKLQIEHTSIETKVKLLLDDLNIDYTSNKYLEGTSYKPDFLLHDHDLIVECDGLYWHSDQLKNKKYHVEKLKVYEQLGYTALFFRENEIRDKFPIVRSIILNKLGLSTRYYARKLRTCEEHDKFFIENNHLMGIGRGRIFGLYYLDEPKAVMQVCWKNKKNKVLEISRFCTEQGTTVIGGFSKLLNVVKEEYKPNSIVTFVDRRYGSGNYLTKLSFVKEQENLSFKWTDFYDTFGRMCFPSNKGIEKGLSRIWDCGQAKFVIHY